MILHLYSRIDHHSSINSDGSLPSVNLTTQSSANQSSVPASSASSNDVNKHGRNQGHKFHNRRFWNNNHGRIQCQLCGRFGHTGFDRSFQGSNANSFHPNSSQFSQAAGFGFSSGFNALTLQHDLNKENQWFPDSGTSNHVISDLANLGISTEYLGDNKVLIGNGAGSQ
ncbi:uncharacterized protein LOC111020007 [Momordica charantia]|uniref:Uncharacterized protein LOC111020007 n=1 Tax=Momordica charantia TaxID=3673 RepID=A0A6J1DDD5_MOMCH|nr:uncharacterized protein LOC111020007 [Momordica charantia]